MKILSVYSGILCFGIRNPTNKGTRNPSCTEKEWNRVPGIRNPRRGIQNPESRIPLHGEGGGGGGEERENMQYINTTALPFLRQIAS